MNWSKQQSEISKRIVQRIFARFDRDRNNHLTKFEFASSLNSLSKIVGGVICPRSDLDCIFQLIDTNGDQTISKKEYMIFIQKFVDVMKAGPQISGTLNTNTNLGYQKLYKFSCYKLQDIETY